MTFGRMVVQISQQRRKVTDGVSVICPNNRKRLTFVGQDAVGRQRARHGRQNALMKALSSIKPLFFFLFAVDGAFSQTKLDEA